MSIAFRLASHLVGGGLLACVALLLVGCATTPKIDWNARVGTYTFDQAIVELGPPDRSAALSDGSRVAEWLASRGSVSVQYDGFMGGYVSPRYGAAVYHAHATQWPDRVLRLTFGSDGKLKAWQRVYR